MLIPSYSHHLQRKKLDERYVSYISSSVFYANAALLHICFMEFLATKVRAYMHMYTIITLCSQALANKKVKIVDAEYYMGSDENKKNAISDDLYCQSPALPPSKAQGLKASSMSSKQFTAHKQQHSL